MKPSQWPVAAKITGVALIILVPIGAVMLTFTPFVATKVEKKAAISYSLSDDFNRKDFNNFVEQMKKDPYFVSYFAKLSDKKLAQAVAETFSVLSANRGGDKHLEVLQVMKNKVSSLAVLINHIDLSDDLAKNIHKSPDLKNTFWLFFYEEFKLSMAGLAYRTMYDPEFHLQWDDSTRMAAIKLQNSMQYLDIE